MTPARFPSTTAGTTVGRISLALLAALLTLAGPASLAAGTPANPAADAQASRPAIRVRTVHPRRGADLSMTVEQPADVAAYYIAPLFAELSGKVTFLEKDLGQTVIKGEKIAVIESRAGGKSASETLTAPFDGVISGRGVDPGGFVPNAGLVPGATPLVTLQRNDIVTVSARMPDRVASLIGKDTEAEIWQDGLPGGGPLRGRITRLAPSLTATDRTIRVEVDLWNRTAAEFRDFMARSEKEQHADLKGREPPQLPAGLAGGQAARLIPGSYGRMRLVLRRFADTPLLPGAAIVRAGGVPYVYRVDQGIARRTRVAIDLEDGTLARVVMLTRENGNEQRREWADTDVIIVSNQGELEDGQPVTAVPAEP
jgi:multidrug efflux pump subunit AcrA (membrane-fusion protein)